MNITKALAQPCSTFVGTATHATCTTTFTKPPQSNNQSPWGTFITKIEISGSAAPAATVEATLTGAVNAAGQAVTIKWEIPANAFAPIIIDFGTHPLRCAANTDVVLTVPDLGSGVICACALHGYYDATN
jgi:hypothetical protein